MNATFLPRRHSAHYSLSLMVHVWNTVLLVSATSQASLGRDTGVTIRKAQGLTLDNVINN